MPIALTTPIAMGKEATQYQIESVTFDRDGGTVTTVVQLLDANSKVLRTVTTTESVGVTGFTSNEVGALRTKVVNRQKVLGVIN